MASQRVVGEASLSNSGPSHHHHHQLHHPHHHHHNNTMSSYAVFRGLNPPSTSFINQDGSSFDFGELEEAIVLQGVKINCNNNNDESKPSPLYAASVRPAATLEMFPSWPTRLIQTTTGGSSKSGGESTDDSGSALNNNTLSSRGDQTRLDTESPVSRRTSSETQQAQNNHLHHLQNQQQLQLDQQKQNHQHQMANINNNHDGPKSEMILHAQAQPSSAKPTTEKTLRRLAQNREAARKSRLRKKAYVQQLETSRIRLTQIEQDLQRARAQGIFLGGGGPGGNISSGAAMFDMEYARWLDDDQRYMSELRTALQAHLVDGDLRVIVDRYFQHYDEIFQLKGVAVKSDVFHLITGMWTTPAERCFLWMGGFRPSELIKMLIAQLDPLTEQQVVGIYGLQHSSQQAEEALTQGLEQLQQSLVETIASGTVNDGMHHMAVALGKLTNLEGFVRQADNLRQQTLHHLPRILTVRQVARCFLVIGEYYGRLRALSSLWASRPRESMIGDETSCQTSSELQIVQVQQSSQNQFSNF
ncbi:OLC1v1004592C2 [Oldenlandia corymbosa var. corymbosa]|uniref:OLC1v1004592C2 n=1 Tax=Oldenlandia corymbosa var. corymbosa TaxID=529605 RepID=A0AAV1DDB9_OLDCO|nr:OLC1v1004592C2 [Oldenlandia corymbosa var. corymbosa]